MLRGFFDEGEVQELREAMGGLLQKAVPEQLPDVGVDRWLGAEGQALRHSLGVTDPEPDAYNPARVTYIDNVHKYDPVFDRHLRHPRLLRALSELLGDDIDAFQCATSIKPSQWDGEDHGWHQDTTYYGSPTFGNRDYRGMTNFGNLCCITYLQQAGKQRGGTEVIPRTHRNHDRSAERLLLGTTVYEDGRLSRRSVEGLGELLPDAVSPSFEAGDVLLFDSWVLHRADSNFQEDMTVVGLVNVYCRPDCKPLQPSGDVHVAAATSNWPMGPAVLRGGELVPAGAAAAAADDTIEIDAPPTAASVSVGSSAVANPLDTTPAAAAPSRSKL